LSRRIVTKQLQSATSPPPDGYFDRVVKYVPSDVIGAWVAADQMIKAARNPSPTWLLWLVFGLGFLLAFLWTLRQSQIKGLPPATVQAGVASIAFAVWVFALGGPFAHYAFYDPLYGGLVLILATLTFGLFQPRD